MDTDEDNNELEELSGISGADELEDLANWSAIAFFWGG